MSKYQKKKYLQKKLKSNVESVVFELLGRS